MVSQLRPINRATLWDAEFGARRYSDASDRKTAGIDCQTTKVELDMVVGT